MSTDKMGFSTYDAINVCLKWLEECDEAGYQANMAGGWVEVFVDEFKRGIDTDDDQSAEWSDHDIIKYWYAILGEALRHIESPNPAGANAMIIPPQLELDLTNE